MKRLLNVFVAIALILGLSLPAASATYAETPKADITFTILHTNDFHGNLQLSGRALEFAFLPMTQAAAIRRGFLADAVRQWGNLAALVAALYERDLDLLGRSLLDVVAEPRRAMLIPGFAEVKAAAMDNGALGCSISGSGPTMFALCATQDGAWRAGRAMQETFRRVGLECDLYVSPINRNGPVCLEKE